MQNSNLNKATLNQQNGSSETRIPIISSMLEKYDTLWQTFIRPPKKSYPIDTLGPDKRKMSDNISYDRLDSTVKNHKNLKLEFSIFQIKGPSSIVKPKACMVYLHSHGGNRTEGTFILKHAYQLGLNVCLFDFSGSGISEGDYVTLGFEEHHDIDDIINHLKLNYGYDSFYLWGRSMGSVAALMYAELRPENIEFMVLDSPFSSIINMVNDASKTYVTLPDFVVEMLFSIVTGSCSDRIGYDLSLLKPIECARNIKEIYSIFVVAKEDKLVLPIRVKEIYDTYQGPKQFQVVDGEHQTSRSAKEIEKIFQYMKNFMFQKNALHNIKKVTYPKKNAPYNSYLKNNYTALGQILPSKNFNAKNFFNKVGHTEESVSNPHSIIKNNHLENNKNEENKNFKRATSKSYLNDENITNLSQNQYTTEKTRTYRKSFNKKDELSFFNNESNTPMNILSNNNIRNNKIFENNNQKLDLNNRKNSRGNNFSIDYDKNYEPSNSTNVPSTEGSDYLPGKTPKEYPQKRIPRSPDMFIMNQNPNDAITASPSNDKQSYAMPKGLNRNIFSKTNDHRSMNFSNNLISNIQKENDRFVENHQDAIGNFSVNNREYQHDQYDNSYNNEHLGSSSSNRYENRRFKNNLNASNHHLTKSFHRTKNDSNEQIKIQSESYRDTNMNVTIPERQRKYSTKDLNENKPQLDNAFLNYNAANINSINSNHSYNNFKHSVNIQDKTNICDYFNKSSTPQNFTNGSENSSHQRMNVNANKMNGQNFNQKILSSISNILPSTPKRPPLISNSRMKSFGGNGHLFRQQGDNHATGPTLDFTKIDPNKINLSGNNSRTFNNNSINQSPHSKRNTNKPTGIENVENNQSFRRKFS